MEIEKTPSRLITRHTTVAAEYLDQVGAFLGRRPVEHTVLLSTPAGRFSTQVAGAEPSLWIWVGDQAGVVATAQHTPPHGAYLSTGPADAMRALAQTLWQLRPGVAGVTGHDCAPQEFAKWSRLGGSQATPDTGQQGLLRLHASGETQPWLRERLRGGSHGS